METIKAQVHMLPTDNKTAPIGRDLSGNLFNSTINLFPQHLYFTTDEEIKDGDICLDNRNNTLFKAKTTDTAELKMHSLKPLVSDVKEGEFYTYIGTNYKQYCRKVVATTNPDLWGNYKEHKFFQIGEKGVPNIPTSFIEEYVKNPVKEVLLECNISIRERKGEYAERFETKSLKLSPDGSVIIHSPKQEKLYTRDELKEVISAVLWDLPMDDFEKMISQEEVDKYTNKIIDRLHPL